MKIGIIFALKEEIDAFLKDLKVVKTRKIYDLIFYEISYFSVDLVLVESGVGKVNAARTTQVLIDNYLVNYIINIGVAGGVTDNLEVFDIVIGKSLIQHDFDITAFDHEKGYIPNIGTFIECDKKLVNIAKKIDGYSLKEGVIASGDIFITKKDMSQKINSKFNAICVEMEGASIAQVAKLCNIPFLIIRSISDTLNNDNKISYEKFLNKSSLMVSKYMKEVLKK